MEDLFDELNSDTELKPLLDSGFSTSSLVKFTAGKTPPPKDCESSQSGQVDVLAGVTQLKTKMVLVDGSFRYTFDIYCLGMEADAEEPGLKIQGQVAKERKREKELKPLKCGHQKAIQN
ncbi:hypothetical protein LAZ67_3001915 [Cordylochernes scorpioides]|uniref:Uncharacterized protein n=1 Tax=Cordylochernes scorpioides TaxID=51811 RepID=A0ABY6K7F8_9ARAC|nr:hypothetical protein LAZ67_3001915 [Cordylochernes scorpioides]